MYGATKGRGNFNGFVFIAKLVHYLKAFAFSHKTFASEVNTKLVL